MTSLGRILFPTFVLWYLVTIAPLCRAAKQDPSPDIEQTPTPSAANPVDDIEKRDTVDLAVPPPIKVGPPAEKEYFYPYRHAITVRAGQVSSSTTTNNTNSPMIGGVQFFYLTPEWGRYEAGADLLSDGTGAVSLA